MDGWDIYIRCAPLASREKKESIPICLGLCKYGGVWVWVRVMLRVSFGGVVIGCRIFECWSWGAASRRAGYIGLLANYDHTCEVVSGCLGGEGY